VESKYKALPYLDKKYIDKQTFFFLFETSYFDSNNYKSYVFLNPCEILQTNDPNNVFPILKRLDKISKQYYLAGFFSYESGYVFQNRPFPNPSTPLLSFGVFKQENVYCFDHKTGTWDKAPPFLTTDTKQQKNFVKNVKLNISFDVYKKKLKSIYKYIEQGETYQTNFTDFMSFKYSGAGLDLYQKLKGLQPVPYSAYLKIQDKEILSFSPELFFRREGPKLVLKPMKGTIKRGRTTKEDKKQVQNLLSSEKEKAENLMIVDLARNDLGKIAEIGSVKVEKLFTIEKYKSLFQMTSTITGILKKPISYSTIFKSLFPSGSVTGAPKKRTMEIIQSLEKNPRGIYCGALGFTTPEDRAIFNIPIRTIELSQGNGKMGVGSGITYSSKIKKEYEECLLKTQFLTHSSKKFSLIESIRWEGELLFLNEHLKRLKDSAEYFQFVYDEEYIRFELNKIKFPEKNKIYKIRILLSEKGEIQITIKPLRLDKKSKQKICLSSKKTNSQNVFLYHKTTNREMYNKKYEKVQKKGYYDVLFCNENKELTEGSRNNVFLRIQGQWFSPPLKSGLLNGIYREKMLDKKQAKEKVLYKKDLFNADKIILTNSVRLEQEVLLHSKTTGR